MIEFSSQTAILLVLICSFMWGSWIQTIKRLNGYPLAAYMLWVYILSVVVVWGGIFLLKDLLLSEPVGAQIARNRGRVALCALCGALAAIGMQNKMWVVERLGLILASSLSSTFSILVGTFYSILLGGLPQNSSLWKIILATLVMLASALVCQISGIMRDRDRSGAAPRSNKGGLRATFEGRGRVLALAIGNLVFIASAYPIGVSVAVRTVSNPNGVDSLLGIGIMCLGAVVGTLIFSGVKLIRRGQVNRFLHPPKRIFAMAAISAVGHYGGNLLNFLASPSLSAAVAWPMSNSFSMWSYSWGLLYGEYRGARKATYAVLALGIALSVLGIVLFSVSING